MDDHPPAPTGRMDHRAPTRNQIMDDHPPAAPRRMDHRVETPREICDRLCEVLILDNGVREAAVSISGSLLTVLTLREHRSVCIAAVSVYIAWYLLSQTDDTAAFIEDLSHTSRVYQDHIISTFQSIRVHRMQVIVSDILPTLAESHMEGIFEFLPAPDGSVDLGSSEEEIVRELGLSNQARDDFITSLLPQLTLQQLRFQRFHRMTQLELFDHLRDILLDAMEDELPRVLIDRWNGLLEAMCDFIACHLLGINTSYSDIARVYSVHERHLRKGYSDIFPYRGQFVRPEVAEQIGVHNLERVLGALPALNWPPVSE